MVGGAIRFAAIGGAISDIGWLASQGFDEAGLTVPNGNNPSPAFIHNAGITTATLNPFNDAGDGPGTAGDKYVGYMQAIKSNGWNIVAGEGRSGDIVRVVMNTITYENFGGIVSEQQYDMYASPWSHPASGPQGHVDYIETYDNYRNYVWDSCYNSCAAAQNHGTKELGILIGGWGMNGQLGSSGYIAQIDRMRSAGINISTVLFWTGNGEDVVGWIKGVYNEVFNGIKNHYGLKKGIGGGGGVVSGNKPHIWCGLSNQTSLYTGTSPTSGTVVTNGQQGFIDAKGAWVPAGSLTAAEKTALRNWVGLYSRNTDGGVARICLMEPNTDGGFVYTITGPGTVESLVYNWEGGSPNSTAWSGSGVWGTEMTMDWTEESVTPPDNPSQGGGGGGAPELVPVDPIPTAKTDGLTVVLRNHKKKEGEVFSGADMTPNTWTPPPPPELPPYVPPLPPVEPPIPSTVPYTGGNLAGFRFSSYGWQATDDLLFESSPSYWTDTGAAIASNFDGFLPSGVVIVGDMLSDQPPDATICHLHFPGTDTDTINYSETDEVEHFLTAFDIAGVYVWLQVEAADADVVDLIDIVLGRYSHHSCVIGFGMDCEWYQFNDNNDPDLPGGTISDETATSWINTVRSYNSDYRLFLKHWLPDNMPPTYHSGIVYIQDSQQFGSYDDMIQEFIDWGIAFSDCEVGFQYGYPNDEGIWGTLDNPMKQIGDDILNNVSNCIGLYWVDFTIRTVYP